MTTKTAKIDTYIDHEALVAERYRWWGVYLVREKRRLQGIAQAVATGTPLVAHASKVDTRSLSPNQLPDGVETPEELLTRVDAEMGMTDALAQLEAGEPRVEESKAHGNPVRNEQTIPDDVTRRKLSGRAALLGKTRAETSEDF